MFMRVSDDSRIFFEKKLQIILQLSTLLIYLNMSNKQKHVKMKDFDLRNLEVKTTQEVPTQLLEMMKDTQEFGKRYFNDYDYNKEEVQRRINDFERKNANIIKYTDGKNILITIDNKVWDGVSMLVK